MDLVYMSSLLKTAKYSKTSQRQWLSLLWSVELKRKLKSKMTIADEDSSDIVFQMLRDNTVWHQLKIFALLCETSTYYFQWAGAYLLGKFSAGKGENSSWNIQKLCQCSWCSESRSKYLMWFVDDSSTSPPLCIVFNLAVNQHKEATCAERFGLDERALITQTSEKPYAGFKSTYRIVS